MPAIIAIGAVYGLTGAAAASAGIATVAAGAKVASDIYSANKQASSADKAAQLTTAATTHGADLQSQANANALAFQKQQAEQTFQSGESNRKANYDQWASQQQRIGSVGQMLGLGGRDIPAYVPGVDPNFTGPTQPGATGAPSGPGAPPAPGAASASIDPTKGDLGAQISGYFKSRGVSDQETPYWVQKWGELTARGQQIGDPQYAMKRLAAADVFGGATTPSSTAAPQVKPYQSVGSYLAPPMNSTPIAPGVQMPQPYRVGAVGSYL